LSPLRSKEEDITRQRDLVKNNKRLEEESLNYRCAFIEYRRKIRELKGLLETRQLDAVRLDGYFASTTAWLASTTARLASTTAQLASKTEDLKNARQATPVVANTALGLRDLIARNGGGLALWGRGDPGDPATMFFVSDLSSPVSMLWPRKPR
jgi:hypothetical protein